MDLQLILALIAGIATIVVIVLATRLDAFIALLAASVVTGIVAGQDLLSIVDAITTGFGNTLASIGIVIGLGVGIGKILEVSGAADSLARAFLRAFGDGREAWAMGTVGSLVSIPVFCDSGYVIMNPLARSIARVKRGGYVTLALALGCGMTLTHHMVPPTPGPLAATGILGADIGSVILTGVIFTVLLLPVVVIYARWIGPKLEPVLNAAVKHDVYGSVTAASAGGHAVEGGGDRTEHGNVATMTGEDADAATTASKSDDSTNTATSAAGGSTEAGNNETGATKNPGAFLGFLPLIVPLLLIVGNTVSTAIDKSAQGELSGDTYEPSAWVAPLAFLGNPVIALMIGLILAVYTLLPRMTPRNKVQNWLADGAASAGLILLITGAGGAFGMVLTESGVGDALAEAIASISLPAFLVPFVIASLVRIAQGSGTVAMITAASVTAPLIAPLGLSPLVAVMACTAGSMVFSYFNDSYFWVVTRFTGLDGMNAIKGWSGITTAVWAGSIPLLFVLDLIV
ncbi:GntP family permease [Brevibacterium aurantiacum]|uniref:Gluconate permease n=1 Tax=Brevibacterium aurantiacum TaxID=273384 RepID=A0A1D7W226_BREAU|nr:SLC13 family permease [Brevibacterium aurantiacum]MDN6189278.1 GntP family permease [Brevibacterium sp.]AOP53086.1 Gluconate permease [Brevibacterium aurantiacum]PCC52200.1 gluconate permease [Brevibacterium aurantiacum]RCS99282.1 GntP family permease [Brevibacterium aurantiacum]SMX75197.1 gluconate:H+ symporter, GntP family [Brevibacterium aurantiacum]